MHCSSKRWKEENFCLCRQGNEEGNDVTFACILDIGVLIDQMIDKTQAF